MALHVQKELEGRISSTAPQEVQEQQAICGASQPGTACAGVQDTSAADNIANQSQEVQEQQAIGGALKILFRSWDESHSSK